MTPEPGSIAPVSIDLTPAPAMAGPVAATPATAQTSTQPPALDPDNGCQHVEHAWRVTLAGFAAAAVTSVVLMMVGWGQPAAIRPSEEVLRQFNPVIWPLVTGLELDRRLYVMGLLIFPLTLLTLSILVRSPYPPIRTSTLHGLIVGGCVGFLLWFALVAAPDLRLPLRGFSPYWFWPAAVAIAGYVYWAASRSNDPERAAVSLGWPRLIAMVFLLLVAFSHAWIEPAQLARTRNPHSFNAVFDANVQVFFGRPLLCNGLVHQYGLYPHFLEPVFVLTGFGVGAFSTVMQVLSTLVLLSFYWTSYRYTGSQTWAFGTFLISLYIYAFYGFYEGRLVSAAGGAPLDIYYQYAPLRLIFPAAFFMLLCDDRSLNGAGWWAAQILMAVGILWNFDFGVPVWLTWQIVLWFDAIARNGLSQVSKWLPRGLAATGVGLLAVAVSVLAFHCYIAVRYGQQPDWSQLLVYQDLFYRAGLNMLPMPLWGSWQAVLATYATGLVVAMLGVLQRNPSRWMRITLGLSIFGCGMFSYYNGRSHTTVLPAVVFPALLLASGLIYSLIQKICDEPVTPLQQITRGALVALCSAAVAIPVTMITFILPESFAALSEPLSAKAYRDEVAFVKQWSAADDKLLIIAPDRSGLLQLLAGRSCNPAAPALVECIAQTQVNQWRQLLRNGDYKFLLLDNAASRQAEGILALLSDGEPALRFQVLDQTPSGSLLILRTLRDDPPRPAR